MGLGKGGLFIQYSLLLVWGNESWNGVEIVGSCKKGSGSSIVAPGITFLSDDTFYSRE